MATVIVDGGVIGVAGAPLEFQNRLTQAGATYDLTDKTVVASIRKESDPYTPIADGEDTPLEDLAVTLANDTYTAEQGGVTLALTAALTTHLAPSAAVAPRASMVENFLLQYKVTTDDYDPQALRFGMRRRLD